MRDKERGVSEVLKNKLSALQGWQDQINSEAKKKGTGMAVLGAGESIIAPRMPTGSPSLDVRLGGGWPRGAISEVFGPNGSGKSTIAYGTIAELHKREPGALAVLIDVEGSYSSKRGAAMGIDKDRLKIFRINTAEPALQKMKELLEMTTPEGKPVVDLIVLDSVASLVTDAEDEGDLADAQVGVLARLMSKTCRQFSALAARNGATIIFTNQIRMKIGVMYGNPETTPGGEALKFYAWSRVRTSRKETLRDGENEIGQLTKAKIEKAKLDDSVGGEAIVRINRADGLDGAYDIATLGVALGVVKKSGNALSAVTAAGEVKGPGKDAFVASVKANQAARTELYEAVVKAGLSAGSIIDEVEADLADSGEPAGGSESVA